MKTILKSSNSTTITLNEDEYGTKTISKLFHNTRSFENECQVIELLNCALKPSNKHKQTLTYPFLESLQNRLQKPRPMKEACKIMLQVCIILKELQQKALIHRDIKPSNLFFDKNNKLLINDFETIQNTQQTTPSFGRTCGTPTYMPPEQFKNDTITHLADQYAAGAILFHLLCGAPPYNGQIPLTELHKQKSERAPNPGKLNLDLSAPCCAIVKRMMAPAPKERYQNLEQLVTELEALLQEKRSLILEAPSVKISTPAKAKDHKVLYGAIAILVIYIIYRLSIS